MWCGCALGEEGDTYVIIHSTRQGLNCLVTSCSEVGNEPAMLGRVSQEQAWPKFLMAHSRSVHDRRPVHRRLVIPGDNGQKEEEQAHSSTLMHAFVIFLTVYTHL